MEKRLGRENTCVLRELQKYLEKTNLPDFPFSRKENTNLGHFAFIGRRCFFSKRTGGIS